MTGPALFLLSMVALVAWLFYKFGYNKGWNERSITMYGTKLRKKKRSDGWWFFWWW